MAKDELPVEWHDFESDVLRRAQRLIYPPTPNLVPRLAGAALPRQNPRTTLRRRLAWALIVVVVTIAGLTTVEPVRAWVAEILRLGAVRILPSAAAPQPTRSAVPVHLGWAGKTSLAEAADLLPFTVQLPRLPADLGKPDAVYVQDLNGPALLMVWMDPKRPRSVRLTLHALSSEAVAYKMGPPAVAETRVNRQPALWTNGPYIVAIGSGEWVAERQVTGHVLIWREDDVTYRLETGTALQEAVTIAESLQPWSVDE